MYTLLIDTHMSKVILVLYKNGRVIKKIEEESKQSHSILTMPLLKKILEDALVDIRQVNDIIVVNGPGSFTGVRIGVTIAKTISFCLNLPIRVISSLEVLASNLDINEPKIVAFNDRNGYFIGKFSENNELQDDYQYLSNLEYTQLKNVIKIWDSFLEINYEKVYEFTKTKEVVNPHLVNPLYVKKIEVQK